jgi:uncharacterized repeat protein (TIGR03803 family)
MTKLEVPGLFSLAPRRGLQQGRVRKLGSVKMACISCCLFCVATAMVAPAQTFTSLLSFDGTNGANPQWGALVQGRDGNFYGTTSSGGLYGYGTVFKITPGGTLTTLHSFSNGADGSGPIPGLALASDGDFYGVNSNGGNLSVCSGLGCGVAFKITAGGTLTTLHEFNGGADGGNPQSALVQATNGNFYGTAVNGGTNGYGAIFEMTPAGALTTLHDFDFTDGSPQNAQMVQGRDGDLYGETAGGGLNDCCGTAFRITPGAAGGAFTMLQNFSNFSGADGANPTGGLIQTTDSNLYGDASFPDVFKMSPYPYHGLFILLPVDILPDGTTFDGGLIQATDGNLYGTTVNGSGDLARGFIGDGSIFKINFPGFVYPSNPPPATLYSFGGTDGASPHAGLLQGTDGAFYGTTSAGGSSGNGTVFRLSTGLGPFVSFLPATRPVGQLVEILGQGFTGATGVSFNGTAASFAVESDTYLAATVPAGATTGSITVTEAGGTLTSNKIFRVEPEILSVSPSSGPVGKTLIVTGENFTKTYAVVFGVPKARFTVDSDTQLTVTVPPGAQTTKFAVLTPDGTAYSPDCFVVTP